MVDRKFARAQIKRLAQLDYFPPNTDALNELIAAAMIAANEEALKASITSVIEDTFQGNKCPKPAVLRRIVQTENEKRYPPHKTNCPHCRGTGFTPIEFLVTTILDERTGTIRRVKEKLAEGQTVTPGINQQIVSGVEKCSCRVSFVA